MNPADPITVEEIAQKIAKWTMKVDLDYPQGQQQLAAEILALINARAGSQGGGEDARSAVIEAARDLVMKPGGLVNRGVDRGLVVVEKADGSDPHARLCDAFKALDALPADVEPQQPKADVEAVGRIETIIDESTFVNSWEQDGETHYVVDGSRAAAEAILAARQPAPAKGEPVEAREPGDGPVTTSAAAQDAPVSSAVPPSEPVEALVEEARQKAAAEVVAATVQDAEGRWIIAGDGEILISRLADALSASRERIEALEGAIAGLKFGGYPAHGSGFVVIVTAGGEAIQAIQAALKEKQDV